MRALITGGSRGIGKSIALEFVRNEIEVILIAKDEEKLDLARKDILRKYPTAIISTYSVNLSNEAECKIFSKELSQSEALDILVNNAGTFVPGKIKDEEEGVLKHLMDTNLFSAYNLTRGLLGSLRKSENAHIFNMCSVASIMPYENGGSYAISKYALLGFSKCLREELKEENIRVTSIMPGATYTDSWSQSGLPEERFMKSKDIASLIYQTYMLSKNTNVEEIIVRPILGDI